MKAGGELPPQLDPDAEPTHNHHHGFRYDIKDWWCFTEECLSDYCVELNDFGQGDPLKPTE